MNPFVYQGETSWSFSPVGCRWKPCLLHVSRWDEDQQNKMYMGYMILKDGFCHFGAVRARRWNSLLGQRPICCVDRCCPGPDSMFTVYGSAGSFYHGTQTLTRFIVVFYVRATSWLISFCSCELSLFTQTFYLKPKLLGVETETRGRNRTVIWSDDADTDQLLHWWAAGLR